MSGPGNMTAIQPQAQGMPTQWAEPMEPIMGCPPGLEYLTQLDQILVQQQVELFEAFTGIETKNKFAIKNSLGQQCYYAYEESGFCMRQFCGNKRGFMMHIVDNKNQEVVRMVRNFKCMAGCCWCACIDCCAIEIDVESPVGVKIGGIRQTQSFWKPQMDILDANGETVLKLKGPCCVCQTICCHNDIPFKLVTPDGTEVGVINKQWGGCAKEMYTDAASFGVNFPKDLDAKFKAITIGAVFLLNMMLFERSK